MRAARQFFVLIIAFFGRGSSHDHLASEMETPSALGNINVLEYAKCNCPGQNETSCPSKRAIPYHRVLADESFYIAVSHITCLCTDKNINTEFISMSFTLTIPEDGGWSGCALGLSMSVNLTKLCRGVIL